MDARAERVLSAGVASWVALVTALAMLVRPDLSPDVLHGVIVSVATIAVPWLILRAVTRAEADAADALAAAVACGIAIVGIVDTVGVGADPGLALIVFLVRWPLAIALALMGILAVLLETAAARWEQREFRGLPTAVGAAAFVTALC